MHVQVQVKVQGTSAGTAAGAVYSVQCKGHQYAHIEAIHKGMRYICNEFEKSSEATGHLT